MIGTQRRDADLRTDRIRFSCRDREYVGDSQIAASPSERLVAVDGAAAHNTLIARLVEASGAMQQAAIVPHHTLAWTPAMGINAGRRRDHYVEFLDQSTAFFIVHPFNPLSMIAEEYCLTSSVWMCAHDRMPNRRHLGLLLWRQGIFTVTTCTRKVEIVDGPSSLNLGFHRGGLLSRGSLVATLDLPHDLSKMTIPPKEYSTRPVCVGTDMPQQCRLRPCRGSIFRDLWKSIIRRLNSTLNGSLPTATSTMLGYSFSFVSVSSVCIGLTHITAQPV
jgi:hypothetical protein